MNLDFHYYATYIAARLVGYSKNEAETIAHAAQYVDDSTPSRVINKLLPNLSPVPTSHTTGELIKGHDWSEAFYDEILRVWPVFHFLPGNYNEEGKTIRSYNGVTEDKNDSSAWYYDDEAKEQFKLMCLPNSKLAESMINNLNENSSLVEIGLRMHTLADTWAHMYYSGVPAWFTNGAADFETNDPRLNSVSYENQPGSNYHNSLIYLGHTQSGHWPDYAFLSFSCKYPWMGRTFRKDNVTDYLCAIKQLMNALFCIKNKHPFNINREEPYYDLSQENEEVIKNILSIVTLDKTSIIDSTLDQTNVWKANINRIKVNGVELGVPEDYKEDKWQKEAERVPVNQRKNTNYYIFNDAAIRHLNFVKSELEKRSIYLDNIPDKRIINVKLRNRDGRFISFSEDSYPTLSTNTSVVLQLILPNNEPLKNGSIVEIRTTETANIQKDYRYLGAWAKRALHYYTKKNNPSCQKWKIEQDGVEVGRLINYAKPIQLLNIYYSNEPYMQPYNDDGVYYLTTDSNKYSFTIIKQ